jgi:hypothetical protein
MRLRAGSCVCLTAEASELSWSRAVLLCKPLAGVSHAPSTVSIPATCAPPCHLCTSACLVGAILHLAPANGVEPCGGGPGGDPAGSRQRRQSPPAGPGYHPGPHAHPAGGEGGSVHVLPFMLPCMLSALVTRACVGLCLQLLRFAGSAFASTGPPIGGGARGPSALTELGTRAVQVLDSTAPAPVQLDAVVPCAWGCPDSSMGVDAVCPPCHPALACRLPPPAACRASHCRASHTGVCGGVPATHYSRPHEVFAGGGCRQAEVSGAPSGRRRGPQEGTGGVRGRGRVAAVAHGPYVTPFAS